MDVTLPLREARRMLDAAVRQLDGEILVCEQRVRRCGDEQRGRVETDAAISLLNKAVAKRAAIDTLYWSVDRLIRNG